MSHLPSTYLQVGFWMGVAFAALVGTAAWLKVDGLGWWGLFPAGLALVVLALGLGLGRDDDEDDDEHSGPPLRPV